MSGSWFASECAHEDQQSVAEQQDESEVFSLSSHDLRVFDVKQCCNMSVRTIRYNRFGDKKKAADMHLVHSAARGFSGTSVN